MDSLKPETTHHRSRASGGGRGRQSRTARALDRVPALFPAIEPEFLPIGTSGAATNLHISSCPPGDLTANP